MKMPKRTQRAVRARPVAHPIDAVRITRLRTALLRWAAISGRNFFWRRPGMTAFHVLVTEILLAKTRAELVENVAHVLLAKYPTASRLGEAKQEDLEQLLFPLGLHRKRAHHLIACARAISDEFDGHVPRTVEELMKLPFVGRYAANAIACVAYDAPCAVLDANVSRIYQRVFSLPPPPERLALAHDLWATSERILPKRRAKVFNWAILDLGGTVCTAKSPDCERCPLAWLCDYKRRQERGQSPMRLTVSEHVC
jgi:A/G-specific adenine glycosylase